MGTERRAAADALEEIAALLRLSGGNPFRVRAFANGARAVRSMPDFDARVAAGTLREVKGIGAGLAAELASLARDGRSPLLEELRASVPPGVLELARVPGLGPKKARALHDEFEVRSLADLELACRRGRLARMKGFGEKTQAGILEALESMRARTGLLRRDEAAALEEAADRAARSAGGRAFACGAYRRGEVLCDGLDLVVAAPDPESALASVLEEMPHGGKVDRSPGAARATLRGGAALRARAVRPEALGLALLAATGPEGHLRALSALAVERGKTGGAPESEEAFYSALGLPLVPPEVRGDGREIEAARRGALPRLLERRDLRGALHVHTTWSDGAGSVAEMLDASMSEGLSWVGLSDHSPTASYAGGLAPARLLLQQREIDAEAARRPRLRVFKGTECDILGDGSLDYEAAVLDGFDFLVASVHSQFQMGKDEMTRRVVRAVGDPHTTVLGHPTGRLLLGRDGYAIDVPEVLRACARHGVAVELNAHPARLDLDPRWMPLVLELGVTVSIGPDAHEPEGMRDLGHGVAVARRAGLGTEAVLNTRDAEGAAAFFAERRRRGGAAR